MLSRSVNILLYFHLVIQQFVFVIVTKGTPRAGHPLKEGLRLVCQCLHNITSYCPRAGHPLKEGLRPTHLHYYFTLRDPERVIH